MEFSFDEINELLEFFPDSLRQDPLLLGDLSPLPQQQHHNLPHNTTSVSQSIHIQPQNISTIASGSNTEDAKPSHTLKKICHKENERQRRKEMATLYRSLRSFLPLERIKGKRSASDHIHETVGYIKELQNKIESLSQRRDRFNRSFDPSTSIGREHSPDLTQTSVTVRPSLTGFEILMNTAFVGGVKLSGALNILSQQGLSIVRCNSSKVNGRLLHNIETKVNDGICIDPTELQQKLTDYCGTGYSSISSRGTISETN